MSTFKRLLLALPVALALGAVGACSSISNTVDCSTVCQRYADCFNSSYDVAACESRCRSNLASDSQLQSQMDSCDVCMDDRSCASATFTCAPSCNGLVP